MTLSLSFLPPTRVFQVGLICFELSEIAMKEREK
jgi:hypothetical protein